MEFRKKNSSSTNSRRIFVGIFFVMRRRAHMIVIYEYCDRVLRILFLLPCFVRFFAVRPAVEIQRSSGPDVYRKKKSFKVIRISLPKKVFLKSERGKRTVILEFKTQETLSVEILWREIYIYDGYLVVWLLKWKPMKPGFCGEKIFPLPIVVF